MNCNKRISSKKRNGQHVKKPRQATNTLSNPHQENSDEGFESLSFPEKEYEMLRTEILQYMEEYQSVRNMMYIATAAILGMNSAMFQNYYLFLLPLIVILPSYIVFYNYWKAVSCASAYIQVFLEDEYIQATYHWELRHRYFSRLHEEDKIQAEDKLRGLDMHIQQLPYLVCGCLCMALYWINMLWKYASPYFQATVGGTWSAIWTVFKVHFLIFPDGYSLITTWRIILDVSLGISLSILFGCIFKIYWNVHEVEMTRIWEHVKNMEVRQEETLRRELGLHPKRN